MRKLLAFWLCLLAAPAFAEDVRPEFLAPYIHSQAPLGHATYRKLLIKVYDANLWTDESTYTLKSPLALSLTYDVSIDSEDFVDRTIKEMAHISGKSQDELASYRPMLGTAFPSVKSGDTITALYVPGKAVTFFYNGKQTAQISGKNFAEYFFGIWLSPKTSEPSFRQAMLGSTE